MTMDERELKSALEAIIFASGEPVPAARISLVLGVPEEDVFSCAAGLAEEYEHEGRGIRLVRLDKSLQMCSAPQYAKTIARVIEHRAPPKLSPPALQALEIAPEEFEPVLRGLALRYGEGRGVRLMRYEESLQLCTRPQYREILEKVLQPVRRQTLTQAALETLAVIAYFQPVTRAYVDEVRGVDSSYTVSSLVEKGLIEAAGRLEAPGRPTLYRTTEAFLRVMGVSELEELPPLPDMSSTDGLEKLQGAINALRGRGEQMEMDLENQEIGGDAL